MRTATPVRHLLEDDRARPVGDLARDLDAAVHRARVHDDRVGLRRLQPLARSGRRAGSTRGRVGKQHPALALELDAQHHHDVGAARSRPRGAWWTSHARARRCRAGSACAARDPHRRAHAWSADGCSSAPRGCARCRRRWRPSGPASVPLRRRMVQRVEQRLGRVLVRAVAGVDHARRQLAREQVAARPAWRWRIDDEVGRIASRLRAVSSSVSPLLERRRGRRRS